MFSGIPNEEFARAEVEDIYRQIDFLQKEINAANLKVDEGESLILKKEVENLELRQKIQSIEGSFSSSYRKNQALCNCTLF